MPDYDDEAMAPVGSGRGVSATPVIWSTRAVCRAGSAHLRSELVFSAETGDGRG
jgi:hypothetical protein